MIVPIFPLKIFLLPDGVTQLRIFEQRYLNMVKNAAKTQGFVIAYNTDSGISEWGSWVDIVDFEAGEDGLLNIIVSCKQLVGIGNTMRQDDDLLLGEIEPLMHWPVVTEQVQCQLLQEQLEKLFNEHPSLQKLYTAPRFDRDDWVCARWLELLPISFDGKKHFVKPNSFPQAVEFLNTIIFKEN
ncbi:MAG: hypothetical protein MK214_17250 [Thalassotalea sp.]|nr:hypothetical protein [Thalassotalea sp.]